jgi:GDP-4-dehydro-6-deoxy-D-mannose reductase
MRILVTGVTGFAGGHLAEALAEQPGVEVVGLARRDTWPAEWRHLDGRVALWPLDLCDRPALEAKLQTFQPERIFHLAGYAHAGQSFREPDMAWIGNLKATRSLYDAVVRWGGRPRILFVGSGLIYGDVEPGEPPPQEDAPLRPGSPYACSKAAADLLSYQYTRSPGLDIVRARPLNHIGPRQSPRYAVAHFAQQVAAIERGRQPPVLDTGNLTPVRDLTDVRDVVAAYRLLMDHGRTGEAYNVASGEGYAMQAVVDRLIARARVPVEVRQQARLVRAAETAVVRADASKLRRDTNWTPRFALDQTLTDILDYWRQQP